MSDTLQMFRKLMQRKKAPTARLFISLLENRRLGMKFRFDWEPRYNRLQIYHEYNMLCQSNTVVLFFEKDRVAIATSNYIFEGDDPILSKTIIANKHACIQLKYRCNITNQIVNGVLLICLQISIDKFKVPHNENKVAISELLDKHIIKNNPIKRATTQTDVSPF